MHVGPRTNKTLNRVLISLKLAQAKKIFTDKLKHYRFLIEKKTHCTKARSTNHIERVHLNFRTHLKRLNRRSIYYSRSVVILISILKIYLRGVIENRVDNLWKPYEENTPLARAYLKKLYNQRKKESFKQPTVKTNPSLLEKEIADKISHASQRHAWTAAHQ